MSIEKQLCINKLPFYYHLTDIIKSYAFEDKIVYESKKKSKKILNRSIFIIGNTKWSRRVYDEYNHYSDYNQESWLFCARDKVWVFYDEDTDDIIIYNNDDNILYNPQIAATNCYKCGKYQITMTRMNKKSRKYLLCSCNTLDF
jgi:hypothetical protein